MPRVPIAELILDYDFWPRGETHDKVSSVHVRSMQDAVEAGHTLPPIVVCRRTKRISDGFHRYTRAKLFDGPDATIDVIWKDYKNDAEMFEDVLRLNSAHGLKLDPVDVVRSTLLADKHGLSRKRVAEALNRSQKRLEDLFKTRKAAVRASGEPVALKGSIRHKAGQTLTKEQEDVNDKLTGNSQAFTCRQITMQLESGLMETGNDNLLVELKRLYAALKEFFRLQGAA